MIRLALALLLWALPAFAGWQTRDSNYDVSISGSAPAPTWTPTDIEENAACGFATTCTQAVSVTAGFIVVGVAGYQGSTISAVTACTSSPVSLSKAADTGAFNTNYVVTLWYGTVACSGSQNIVATSASANSWFRMLVGVGTLANLTSTTPTTSCNGSSASVSGGALACSSAVTVPSAGFAIGFGMQTVAGAPNFTNMTNDKSISISTFGGVLGNSAVAGSLTPNMNGLTNTTNAGIVAATWD